MKHFSDCFSEKLESAAVMWVLESDKDHRLRSGNLKAPATVLARQHIVNPHHVVSGFLETCPILLVRASWGRRLSGAF